MLFVMFATILVLCERANCTNIAQQDLSKWVQVRVGWLAAERMEAKSSLDAIKSQHINK